MCKPDFWGMLAVPARVTIVYGALLYSSVKSLSVCLYSCDLQMRVDVGFNYGGVLRFLDHIKNEDSPGPPIGSHHAFFSDDQEPYPVTDIADLIRDSYEVQEPLFHPSRLLLVGDRSVPGM